MSRHASASLVRPLTVALLALAAHAQSSQTKLLPFDGQSTDHFGMAVALDGDTAFVASPYTHAAPKDAGVVYVYQRQGNTWSFAQELLPSHGDVAANFGRSVDVEGSCAVIGAPRDNTGANASGVAYVFERVAGVWTQTAVLAPPDPNDMKCFGHAVALRGTTLAVTSYDDSTLYPVAHGRVYVYEHSGSGWNLVAQFDNGTPFKNDAFGISLALSDDTILVGAPRHPFPLGPYTGRAYVFERSAGAWSATGVLDGDPTIPWGNFGYALGLSVDRALVGVPGDDTGTTAGAGYVYERSAGTWSEVERLYSTNGTDGDAFAQMVAVEGDRGVIGAYTDPANGATSGSVYVIERTATSWTITQQLKPSDPHVQQWFGVGVAVSGSTTLVGAYGDDTLGNQAGAAYVLESGGHVEPYCVTTPNSVGPGARMSHGGPTSLTQNDFFLRAAEAPPGKLGVFWYGPNTAQVPFGDGVRCISGAFYRLNPALLVTADGTLGRHLDFQSGPPSGGASQILPGSTWNFQFWYRDPAGGPSGFNLSNGLRATFTF